MWPFMKFISYICFFSPSIFAADAPIVNLTYAQYQGVPTLDPVNNETITQFLGIRYAAAPTGKVFFPPLLRIVYHRLLLHKKTGSRRFREPELPSFTPGVQLANKQPSECFQAAPGAAPNTPFRNAVPNTSPTRRLSARSTDSEGSEDCLFLKYIFMLIDMCDMLTMTVVPVSTFLVAWEKRRTFRSFSGYTGIY